MLDAVFLEHPRAVGESYSQHQRAAMRYAAGMLAGGMAAAVHAVLPCFFETTASRIIGRLHADMVARRRLGPGVASFQPSVSGASADR